MFQFDGDYNTLLTHIADLELIKGMTEGSKKVTTVRVFLDKYLENGGLLTRTKSGASILDNLMEEYPGLQIAVPVHAED